MGSRSRTIATNTDGQLLPFVSDTVAGSAEFFGHVLVFASGPRALVSAYLVYHEEATIEENFPVSVTGLTTFPVGQTQPLFQAGTPGSMPTPPLTEPGS